MFKIYDVVEITDSSSATGLLDFVDGKGYEVLNSTLSDEGQRIFLCSEGGVKGWYSANHFQFSDFVENKDSKSLFKIGQVVWDLRNGRGVVTATEVMGTYPIEVKFDLVDKEGNQVRDLFTKDGRYAETHTVRSLYFSEPKIEGALEPLFESVLKVGEPVILTSDINSQMIAGWVEAETPTTITVTTSQNPYEMFEKDKWKVYRVGERVEFK